MANSEIRLPDIELLLAQKGLGAYGKVQMAIDKDVIEFNKIYCPWLTGRLANSPYEHEVGAGTITYRAIGNNGYNYAGYQYYLITAPENYSNQNGFRGNHWNDRMKIDRIDEIIRHAQSVLNGGA